jgi:hypothetical protein
MTAGDDKFLSRWSRRKLAARQPAEEAGPPATPGTNVAADPAAAAAKTPEAMPAEKPDENAGAASPSSEEAVPLPRIEDLEAGSDLSAFLREGVPAALRNGALRKMWSLDPAIRDHVGLAEYAWDFNKPGAMAGFGPLEAGSRIVDFLSSAGRSVLAGKEEAAEAEAPEGAAALPPGDALSPEKIPGPASAQGLPEEPGRTEAEQARGEASLVMPAEAETAPAGRPAGAESAPKPPRRRHGGAVPR